MLANGKMTLEEIGGARARVWIGGRGPSLLLLHGAWGGAELHWSTVWEKLAERFRVIAPELPGVGDASPGLPSFDAYADWVAELLDALDAPDAWCVGNSFGAAVAWQLAARLGPRCRGLVLVNGAPPPALPKLLRTVAATRPMRKILRALFRKMNFSPTVIARAFADPTRAPSQLLRTLAEPSPSRIDLLIDLLLRAHAAPRPSVPVLLAWGASDRLPGTGPEAARKIQRAIPGARLVLIPSAGHCPQLERPAEFVDAIASFASYSALHPN